MRSQIPGFHQHLLLSKPRSPRRGFPFHCPTTSRGCRGNAGRAHGCTARVPHTCAVASPQTRIVISRCCQPIRILEGGLVACTNSAPVTIPPGLILCPTGWTGAAGAAPFFLLLWMISKSVDAVSRELDPDCEEDKLRGRT